MEFNAFFLNFLTGLQLGAIYALIALGLTLIFGTLGVVNFAHGALYMIAAYAAVLISRSMGFTYAIFIVPALLFLVGLLMERGLIRWFYDRPHTDQILVTFGLAIVIEEALKWIFGANNIPFALPSWGSGQVLFYGLGATVPEAIPGLRIPMPGIEGFTFFPFWRLLLIGVSAIVVLGLFVLLQFTRFGLVVRAGMRDPQMVSHLGINVTQKFAIVFGLAAAIAGVAGVFGGPVTQVSPTVGLAYLVPSFLVVVIGGMGSLLGALVAAVLLGMASAFTTGFAALAVDPFMKGFLTALQQIVVYLVAVVVLLVRPRGLFGKKGVFE
ncbi:branched-chain amino acid ABC transporter permease [Lutibaculum baratangense]|uniref:High-affinity branched-chain amino acid transport system permease protein LivH n=1 Tax=Lutibaculum baratangense AMV1 TaxID=631454 RepID=V4TGV1_9HYPH|nr:branched-chain amino acid ABC transporter permease [Lutibaculum baratangense]ESR25313.1 High-affinity branched-chain amino acid transport system permease protein LivH [Lutibaculum baratangense AMV1]